MKSAQTKDAAEDMVDALKDVAKKYTLTTRERAWEALMTPKGKKEIEGILRHPERSVAARIRSLHFKEWFLSD